MEKPPSNFGLLNSKTSFPSSSEATKMTSFRAPSVRRKEWETIIFFSAPNSAWIVSFSCSVSARLLEPIFLPDELELCSVLDGVLEDTGSEALVGVGLVGVKAIMKRADKSNMMRMGKKCLSWYRFPCWASTSVPDTQLHPTFGPYFTDEGVFLLGCGHSGQWPS